MRHPGRWCLWPVIVAIALPAATPATGSEADSTAIEYFAPPGALARAHLRPYGDVRLRTEAVRGRPGATSDLDLHRASVRGGLLWAPPAARARIEAGLRVTVGSDDPGDPWTGILNETADAVDADRLGIRVSSRAGDQMLSVGKQRPPLRLTEMIWDDDLRPVGVTLTLRREHRGRMTSRLVWAILNRSRLDLDDARLGVVQLSTAIREEAGSGADAGIAWLRSEGPKDLARGALARQNATRADASGVRYQARFEIVDLQLGAHTTVGDVPVGLRIDLARNVALSRERDGMRLRASIGGTGVPGGLELGGVVQRVEREAVPGAFTSDDWWFHTGMRGHQVWLRGELGGSLELRLSGFNERRDDLPRWTRRLTAELSARLPVR